MFDAALPQHPLFYRSLSLMGAAPDRISTDDGPVILVRRRLGPWHLSAALRAPPMSAASLRQLRRHGVQLCEPDTVADLRPAGYVRVVTPASVADLPLAGSSSDRRARLHGKWRNRLAHAEDCRLQIRDAPFAGPDADWLVAQELQQRRARRYRALHPDFARAWAMADPGAARLFIAEDHGARIAGMLFLIHGRAATYHIGWSGDRGRVVSAHHLILTQATDRLADRGVRRLDLGTVDTDRAPGLARFKLGTGAVLRPLGGSWIVWPGW